VRDPEYHWRLYLRASEILDDHRPGHALPILRMLAARGYGPALSHLSDFVADALVLPLLRRGAASGDPTSAYNLAIELRNRGRLGAYRHALARAARIDEDAREELEQFRTRFPHAIMRRQHRLSRR
jgi:hypothetical protein